MASADTSGGGGGVDASACARDFIEYRLQEADSPMSPAELADEYGCTNGHIRNMLADMLDEGSAERVGRGQYVAVAGDMLPEGPQEDTEVQPDTAAPSGERMDTVGPDPSPDGEAPSEDTDTEVEDDREGEPATADDDREEEIDEDIVDDQDDGIVEDGDGDDVVGTGEAAGTAVVGVGGALPMLLDDDHETDWALVALLAVAVLGVVWFLKRRGQQGAESEEEQQGDESGGDGSNQDEQPDTPLLEA